MAIINSYPTATPTGSDLIIGTDTSTTPNSTKTFTIDSVNALAPTSVAGATAYIASWTQTSASDPVPVEIFNNTGATFTWARTNTGQYSITASSAVFTADKTFYNIQGSGTSALNQIVQPTTISTTVALYRQISGGVYSDGNRGWVEIRIYP
tara:strand:+ start:186 stop:641 length:456 start_codon:yes stop_codon:yes gene_type:complete